MANSSWAAPFTPRSQLGDVTRNILTAMFPGQGGGAGGGSNRSAAQDEADLAQAFKYMAEGNLDRQTLDARRGIAGRADDLLRQRENSRTRALNLDLAPGDDGLGFDLDADMLAGLIRPESDEPIVRPYVPNAEAPPLNTALQVSDINGRPNPMKFADDWGVPPELPMGMPQPGLNLDALPPGLNLPDTMPEVVMSRGELGPVDPLEQERYITMLGIELAKAFGGNPDQIAGGMGKLQTQGFERGLMSGAVTPEQWFLLNEQPLQDVQDGYAVPRTSMAEPNPLGIALERINTEKLRGAEIDSRIPLNQARVKTEGARQGLIGEQANTQASVRDRNTAAAEKLRRVEADKAGKATAPKKFDVQTIEGEIAALLQEATGETNIDAGLLNGIKARAMELFEESQDHFDAAATAVEEFKSGIEVEGNQWWNPKTNKIVPKPGLGPRKPAPVTMRPPADKQKIDDAAALPPEAARKLKEGVITKFGNGQTWTLQNGVPVRVY